VKKLLFIFSSLLIIGCGNNTEKNIKSFDSAWKRIEAVYPFLEYKEINWDSVYIVYKPLVKSANRKEFRIIIDNMLGELKDVHVYHRGITGDIRFPYKSPRQIRDKNTVSKVVIKKYFDKHLKSSKGVLYGVSPDNIGYIYFNSFKNLALIEEFPEIFKSFKSTKGLIIDIRSPRGGDYNVFMPFVNYLITTPMEKPELFILERIAQAPFQPSESEYVYTKPVIVLINGMTISAGESTAEILKQLPQVTIVGDTTSGGGGCSSDHDPMAVGEFRLLNNLIISVPTGYFLRYDGSHFEWNGVSPDIRVEQNESDLENGIDKQLEYAINNLK